MAGQMIEIVRGVIMRWDRERGTAVARLRNGRDLTFSSTAYRSLAPTTWPRVGAVIEVLFDKPSGTYIRIREIKE